MVEGLCKCTEVATRNQGHRLTLGRLDPPGPLQLSHQGAGFSLRSSPPRGDSVAAAVPRSLVTRQRQLLPGRLCLPRPVTCPSLNQAC